MANPFNFLPSYFETLIPGIRMPPLYVDQSGVTGQVPRNGFSPPIPPPGMPMATDPTFQGMPGNTSASLLPPIPGVGPFMRGNRSTDQPRPEPIDDLSFYKPPPGRNPAPAAMPTPHAPFEPPINMAQAPQAATATPQSPMMGRKPFDWSENANLWPMLMQAGQGMMQPSHYGFAGQLQQGLAGATEAAQKAPMQKLQKRMLEAQVGKVENESAARQSLRDFALQKNLPTGVALSLMLNPEKASEILEKYDPAMKEAFLKFTEEKSGATAKGSFPYDLMKAQAGATNVNIKTQAEFAAKLESLAKFRAAANDPKLSPQARADAQKMAEGIERGITQKDTPDAKFMEQITGMERGVQGAERLRELVKQYGVSSIDPAGRAKIAQEYSWLITAMKQTEGFGAALTGNEQAILEAGLRNPNSFVSNALIGSKTHIGLIEKYIEFTRQRAQSMDRLRRTGQLPPGLSEAPPPPPGFKPMGR